MKKSYKGIVKFLVTSLSIFVISTLILFSNIQPNSNINTKLNDTENTVISPKKEMTENNLPYNPFRDKLQIQVDTKTNTFFIFEIGEDTLSVFESESNLMSMNGVKDININLHSPGGNLFVTKVILEQIKLLKERGIKIHTVVDPQNACMSACPLVFLSGDTRVASGNSVFMFHAPYVQFPYNTPEPMFYVVERDLAKDREEFANTLAASCPLDQRIKLDVLDHKEHYYTSTMLVTKCGEPFFTEVLPVTDPSITKPDGISIITL